MSDYDPSTGRKTATDKREHVRMTVGFFTDDHKLRDVLDPVERMAALALLATCICEARKQGSDGHIALAEICALVGLPIEFGKLLIAEGAVHQADHGCSRCPQPRLGNEYVHDYLEHNHSAAEEEQILEKRRRGGRNAAAARWAGHVPAVKEKRPPGRPRKHPVVTGPSEELLALAEQIHPAEAAPATLPGMEQPHPAETRARSASRRKAKEPRVFEDWVVQAADRLADLIARNDLNGKRPNVTDTWRNTLRLMHEADNREIERIQKAIEWSQTHHFYSTIILSPQNLRKHFNAMHKRAIEEHRGGVRRVDKTVPATVSVTGMAGLLAQQMGAGSPALTGGMIKGGR
jgi:hypothetical protein